MGLGLCLFLCALCGMLFLQGPALAAGPVELYLIPHTHADVGWLQTLDSLSRVNVSRILDGVVGNLLNDTAKRRRFVWDEMAFLQLWWDNQATPAQQEAFAAFVRDGRVELVDNGWSQHDMGCTTVDSMLNNWVEGHAWLVDKFGAESRPKVGWSLDPFGQSGTQAVLQSLLGMEAWFFTRINGATIDEMKANKGLEFVWRASSSLADAETEIFTRILESYYCLPLPTFAFEWGEDRGAKIPSDPASTLEVSETLANITKQRAPWFRTNNVMIPWGCDYMYQNAALMFGSTDKIIDTINGHPEWGVHAQYATPSEYLSAVRASNATFPVKAAGTNFFPFTSWSGYFTSRPKLKGLNTKAHAALNAAEQLFALSVPSSSHASSLSTERTMLWSKLENARRFAGVVQHHDAITGTMCKASEGCAGTDQVVGAHDVLTDYEDMLWNATQSAQEVAATILSESSSNPKIRANGLFGNVDELGHILMGRHGDGGDDAIIVVYNSLAFTRTEMVVVQVPICAVTVSLLEVDGDGKSIPSQVTAEFSISAGQAPFYDFELSFEATIPPLSSVSFLVSPSPADAACGGGDTSRKSSSGTRNFVRHASILNADGDTYIPERDAICNVDFQERVLTRARKMQSNSGNVDQWTTNLASARAEETAVCKHERTTMAHQENTANNEANNSVILENQYIRVTIDKTRGLQSVTDKVLQQTVDVRHELFKYVSTKSDAYAFNPDGPATPLLENASVSVLATTVALGPVMQEVWLQVSAQHKTRIRLWVSDDPEVGRRIELAHRIGVLEPMQDLISRFTVPALQGTEGVIFVSEDNGYEKVEHVPGTGGNIATHHYPSQASAFIRGPRTRSQTRTDPLQLSVTLDRSHAVGSMSAGELDIMQHRRGLPYLGSGGTVVLDDTDRIFTQTWISVGGATQANRDRVQMKLRLNHPLQLFFTSAVADDGGHSHPVDGNEWTQAEDAFALQQRRRQQSKKSLSSLSLLATLDLAKVSALPSNLHLQSVRSVSESTIGGGGGGGVLVRIRHMYAKGEDESMSAPSAVDVLALFGGRAKQAVEVTLTGILPKANLKRNRFPVDGRANEEIARNDDEEDASRVDGSVVVKAFELRTFLVT